MAFNGYIKHWTDAGANYGMIRGLDGMAWTTTECPVSVSAEEMTAIDKMLTGKRDDATAKVRVEDVCAIGGHKYVKVNRTMLLLNGPDDKTSKVFVAKSLTTLLFAFIEKDNDNVKAIKDKVTDTRDFLIKNRL